MARARDTSNTDEKPTEDAPTSVSSTPAPKPDDVLCYVDRLGPMAFCIVQRSKTRARSGGVVIPNTITKRIEPGLSFCPGEHWGLVKSMTSWQDRVKLGACRSVAGHGDKGLVVEWEAVKSAALVSMLGKTFHIETLERLREMEAGLKNPRLDVAQEIDARLAEMGQKVKDHQAKRRHQRRGNRKILG